MSKHNSFICYYITTSCWINIGKRLPETTCSFFWAPEHVKHWGVVPQVTISCSTAFRFFTTMEYSFPHVKEPAHLKTGILVNQEACVRSPSFLTSMKHASITTALLWTSLFGELLYIPYFCHGAFWEADIWASTCSQIRSVKKCNLKSI